jgi:hypothetical protein
MSIILIFFFFLKYSIILILTSSKVEGSIDLIIDDAFIHSLYVIVNNEKKIKC